MLKQDYEIQNQEDEDLRCPICNYYFSLMTKPYLLPCNHNLCATCIESITKKKMYYCPMCRKEFTEADKDKFQVNVTFLNLVVKILKTKVIYCSKCSKIFNWTEHQAVCHQGQFKETNEIFDEIKNLAEDCMSYLKKIDKTQKMKSSELDEVTKRLKEFGKLYSKCFYNKAENVIESFFKNIPSLELTELANELGSFIKLCEPIYSSLNINTKEINETIGDIEKNNQELNSVSEKEDISQGKMSIFFDDSEAPTTRKAITAPLKIVIKNNVSIRAPEEESKGKSHSILKDLHPVDERPEKEGLESNSFDKINYIISIYSNIRDIKQKIINHSRQIEYTTETIKSQINNNSNKYSKKILTRIESVYDSLSVSKEENKETFNPRYLVNFFDNSKKLWRYNVFLNKCDIIEINMLKFKFNSSFSVEYDEESNLVYITGGKYSRSVSIFSDEIVFQEQCLSFPFSQDPNPSDLNSIQMPRNRAFHSSLLYKKKLYLIGGENEKRIKLTECECYNTKAKMWELMPRLNYGRINPTLTVINETYLYVFRGEANEINLKIEFINIEVINYIWKVIEIDDPGCCFSPLIKSAACSLSSNQILICGGCLENKMERYCYIYNTIKKTIYRAKDLVKKACFSHGGMLNTSNNKIYLIDEKNETGKPFGIHVYDIASNSWSFHT